MHEGAAKGRKKKTGRFRIPTWDEGGEGGFFSIAFISLRKGGGNRSVGRKSPLPPPPAHHHRSRPSNRAACAFSPLGVDQIEGCSSLPLQSLPPPLSCHAVAGGGDRLRKYLGTCFAGETSVRSFMSYETHRTR